MATKQKTCEMAARTAVQNPDEERSNRGKTFESGDCHKRGLLSLADPGFVSHRDFGRSSRGGEGEGASLLMGKEFSKAARCPAGRSWAGNCLQMYLTEIGPIKVLNAEGERELAGRIRDGDEEARQQMIKSNLKLVVKIAHEFEDLGLPLLDLISEGNIGLMKAVERFDGGFGTRFSTYACHWIRQAMRAALTEQSRTVRVPNNALHMAWKIKRTAGHLQQLLGREPSDEEVASELHLDASRVGDFRHVGARAMSLDLPVGDESHFTFGDTVADERSEPPQDAAERQAVARLFADMARHLTTREAEIVRARFGLDGASPKHLDELGRTFCISRERVRQVLNSALGKLRKLVLRVEGATSKVGCCGV